MKIAETRDLEDELQRVNAENAELQRRVSEFANIDAAKKKAESKAEQLEEKARLMDHVPNSADLRVRWTWQFRSELLRKRMSSMPHMMRGCATMKQGVLQAFYFFESSLKFHQGAGLESSSLSIEGTTSRSTGVK